ncbi:MULTISPECIES: hypothetical protein [unclassified Mycobacterium]|uniref:hypothetical protein n=1 Tax=unclassified Mycobacterium TaxID=2642494 RepID=UPI0006DC193A|nr:MULTISPECIES: hypothetical protein [unclassified Mycobacterium]
MAGTRNCNAAVIAGRMSKAVEFLEGAEHLEDEMPNAAGDLFIDAGIAASDVICCIRLGMHSNSGTHSDAVTLLERASKGTEKHLNTLLGLKNKAAYTHQPLSPAECKKMNRAASHLVEAARRAVASVGK